MSSSGVEIQSDTVSAFETLLLSVTISELTLKGGFGGCFHPQIWIIVTTTKNTNVIFLAIFQAYKVAFDFLVPDNKYLITSIA